MVVSNIMISSISIVSHLLIIQIRTIKCDKTDLLLVSTYIGAIIAFLICISLGIDEGLSTNRFLAFNCKLRFCGLIIFPTSSLARIHNNYTLHYQMQLFLYGMGLNTRFSLFPPSLSLSVCVLISHSFLCLSRGN